GMAPGFIIQSRLELFLVEALKRVTTKNGQRKSLFSKLWRERLVELYVRSSCATIIGKRRRKRKKKHQVRLCTQFVRKSCVFKGDNHQYSSGYLGMPKHLRWQGSDTRLRLQRTPLFLCVWLYLQYR